MNILAQEIPAAEKGESFLRFICNRLILENEKVRASAVTTLARLGHKMPHARGTIKNILMKYIILPTPRCMIEHADEVRDRAALFLHALDSPEQSVTDFVFGETSYDLTALEEYLTANKETLAKSDKVLSIDLGTMKKKPAQQAPVASK